MIGLLSISWIEDLKDGTLAELCLSRMMKIIFLTQVYVDDIVFGATIDARAIEFSKEVKKEFKMSMVGELTFFLGLQVKQMKEGIFHFTRKICSKYSQKVWIRLQEACIYSYESTKPNIDFSGRSESNIV